MPLHVWSRGEWDWTQSSTKRGEQGRTQSSSKGVGEWGKTQSGNRSGGAGLDQEQQSEGAGPDTSLRPQLPTTAIHVGHFTWGMAQGA